MKLETKITAAINTAFLLCTIMLVSCTGEHEDTGGGANDAETALVYRSDLPVLFSEVYSANAEYKDQFGKDPGWVEFYNPADTAINLNGYSLSDKAGEPGWQFGDVVIAPRGYMTVFLSKRSIPDYHPATDSIDLIKKVANVSDWADKDNDPPGRSTAAYKYSPETGISATLKVIDNKPKMNWASASVSLKFKGLAAADVIDMSCANELVFKGFVSNGSKLRIVLEGAEARMAWSEVITGTGIEDELYVLELPPASRGFPDLKNISGITFTNLWFDRDTIEFTFNSIVARKRASNAHASLSLKRNRGGRLFLINADGCVIDSVAYPPGTLGLSYARNFKTGAWSYSRPPTPDGANSQETYDGGKVPPLSESSLPPSGHYEKRLSFKIPQGEDGIVIGCDMTGALPAKNSKLRSGMTVNLTKTTVMRCAQFKDGAYPSETLMRTYIIGRLPDLPVVSIAVDPQDMFDKTRGVYSMGPNASKVYPYFGANFWHETEIPVQINFFEKGMAPAWTHQAGLRISGRYSRATPKKSVMITFRESYGINRLSYGLFPDNPELTRFKHFILRNNGSNYGYDYIRDMLMTSLTEGLGIDYQRGRAVAVFYNGEYFGIHNLRERANADYFETKYNVPQDSIDLIKMDGEISSGSDNDYYDIIKWLEGLSGAANTEVNRLSDENLKQLESRVDIDNFTYNYMCRMYYKDRDWPGSNMKRWRVNSPPSKWKWFMHDTDRGWDSHWGDHYEPNMSTMDFVTQADGEVWPNPPHSTFLLRKLLENESYKNSFINRFSLLMATYFAHDRVNARIDALMAPIQDEIPHDLERWKKVWWERGIRKLKDKIKGRDLTINGQMNVIRNFNTTRRPEMQRELETYFGLGSGVDLTVSVGGISGGEIHVHNMEVLNGSATFKAYPKAPIVLKAVGAKDAVFHSWSDGVTDAQRIVTVTEGQSVALQAIFK